MELAALDALTESQTFSIAAIPQTGSGTYTMSDGYRRILAMRFDPDFGVLITLRSQRARQNIVTDFNTFGKEGFIILNNKALQDDVINFSYSAFSQGPLVASGVYKYALPYNFTLTLFYGR
jgi:hypothetical protein